MAETGIQEQIGLLRELQQLDLETERIRAERHRFEQELNALQEDVDRIQSMAERLTQELETLEAEKRELDQALAQESDNVRKAEERLPSIKTQKEYVAVLKEVDTAKKLNKEIEERIAQKNAEISAVEQDKQEKEAELAAQQEKVADRKAELESKMSEYDSSLTESEGTRAELSEKIPRPLRRRYQLLVDRRGTAVVEVRQGTCLGCNMQLPPQAYNKLYRGDEIETCPHCNRLVYLEQTAG